MENEGSEEFADRVRAMTAEQLMAYRSAAKNINRALSALGISFILLIILYPVVPMILVGSALVFIFSKTSEGISDSLDIVKARLAKLEKS